MLPSSLRIANFRGEEAAIRVSMQAYLEARLPIPNGEESRKGDLDFEHHLSQKETAPDWRTLYADEVLQLFVPVKHLHVPRVKLSTEARLESAADNDMHCGLILYANTIWAGY